MIVLKKEILTAEAEIEIGDLVQDEYTGNYSIVGFKSWGGETKKGFFVFEFKYNDISDIYDSIEEMVKERELRLIAKKDTLKLLYLG